MWQCKTSLKKGIKCEAPLLYKEIIEKMFIDSFNKLLKNKDEIIENSGEFIKEIDDTRAP
ncbi:MAG: zinc ribbon domain-containing protein [Acutalibacteraceae bacterium]